MYQQRKRTATFLPPVQNPVVNAQLTREPESIDLADAFGMPSGVVQRLPYPGIHRFDTEERGTLIIAPATSLESGGHQSSASGSAHAAHSSTEQDLPSDVSHVLEGDMYEKKWFSRSMVGLMFGSWVVWTALGSTGNDL